MMLDLARMTWTFLWLSLICVGGGLGVVPELERQVVDRHQWVTAREFLDGYTLSQLTPGPNMLVAVFVGYRAHGLAGALLACTAMFLPVSILTAVIARHWETLRERPWALAAERALAPIGIGLMGAVVYTLARSGVQDWATGALALLAAVVLYGRWLPPIALVLTAGLAGWLARL
jgi:chromate transporter